MIRSISRDSRLATGSVVRVTARVCAPFRAVARIGPNRGYATVADLSRLREVVSLLRERAEPFLTSPDVAKHDAKERQQFGLRKIESLEYAGRQMHEAIRYGAFDGPSCVEFRLLFERAEPCEKRELWRRAYGHAVVDAVEWLRQNPASANEVSLPHITYPDGLQDIPANAVHEIIDGLAKVVERRAAANGKPSVNVSDWNELTDCQRNCLRAMSELKAYDADSRQRAEDVAEKAEGCFAKVNGFKSPLSDLVLRGLAESKTGREGGYWLTGDGRGLVAKQDAESGTEDPPA